MAQLEDSSEEDVECDALQGLLPARPHPVRSARSPRVMHTLAVFVTLVVVLCVVAFSSHGFRSTVFWQSSTDAMVDMSRLSEEKETLYLSPHGSEAPTPINDFAIRPVLPDLHDYPTPAPTSYSMQEPAVAAAAAGVANTVGQQGNPHPVGDLQMPSFNSPGQQNGQQPPTMLPLPSVPGQQPFGWHAPINSGQQRGPQPFSNSLQSPMPSNSGGPQPPVNVQLPPFPGQGGKPNTLLPPANSGQQIGQQPFVNPQLPPVPSQGGQAKTLMAGNPFAVATSVQQTGPQKTLMAAKALAAAANKHPDRAPQQGVAIADWAPTQQTDPVALPASTATQESNGPAVPSAFPPVAYFPSSAPMAAATSVSMPSSTTTARQKHSGKLHHGQLEFNSKGGPRTIAGTKVMEGGVEDLSDSDNLTHTLAEVPPPDYKIQNPPIQMYMYRAQSDSNYPMRNVNTADLAGVMWYLHNEIVGFPDLQYKIRHFNITRIVRLLVTLQNPFDFFQEHKERFAPFVSFGAGKCNVPHCDSMWKKYGGLVGCQAADKKVANYESQWKTQPPEAQCGDCNSPLWFSLPGPCPAHEYGAKSTDCIWNFPGGDCGKNPVTGAKDCTYSAKWYGEIRLDDLINVTFSDGSRGSFADFLKAGGREYDKATDKGIYTAFWDGILDKEANDRRMQTVRWQFSQKYPGYPTELQETSILCDFGGWHAGEFSNSGLPTPGVE